MDIIFVFETEVVGSTPAWPAKRICLRSIMDNTLVYEAGDCGSIPYVGAKICPCDAIGRRCGLRDRMLQVRGLSRTPSFEIDVEVESLVR